MHVHCSNGYGETICGTGRTPKQATKAYKHLVSRRFGKSEWGVIETVRVTEDGKLVVE